MLSCSGLKTRHFLFVILTLMWLPMANAKGGTHAPFELIGNIVHNHDGDTIHLQTADLGLVKIRLSGADAPETGQAFWRVARNHLSSLAKGQVTTAWCYKTDQYDREVCHVRIGSTDICLDLIRRGFAWYAHMFSRELSSEQQAAYADAEEQARTQQLGLWSIPEPMPPWACRKLRKAGQKCR